MDLPLIAKQRQHARHGKVVASATTLPAEILEGSVVACFEEQVARHGDRVAVQSAAGAVSYAALNAAANRLAHWIVQLPEQDAAPVAVLLGSRPETVVAILGILKAGRSYVLLEPDWPLARLSDLLVRAGARLILAGQADAARLTPAMPDGARLLRLEALPPGLSEANLDLHITPDQPVRLQFTSGSTGAPKSIPNTHQQTLYSAWQYINSYLCGPADRHASGYRLSSNAALKVVFNPLLSGGSLHLSDRPDFAAAALARWLDEQAITALYLPTVALRELLNVLEGAECLPSVRMVHVAGQTVYRRDAQLFQERLAGGSILVCRYAMSEVGPLTHYLIDRSSEIDTPTIPAGYPLPGRELVILDEAGRELGYDQAGEIAVRRLLPVEWDAQNQGLAQALAGIAGYSGPSDLFRTSDLGLLRPDGCLIHLGRKDDMVKVRGHRVALAEVENLLLQAPGVAQAAVKGFPTPGGDNRLVGYVTPGPGQSLTATGIRQALAELAPSHLIPARFVVLPALPLATTGKVDRQALPEPGTARPELATAYVAPRTELEQQLADLWAELLGLDEVGVADDFFELGGDSLTAMRMALAVEAQCGLSVPADFFGEPTVAQLVRRVAGAAVTVDASRPRPDEAPPAAATQAVTKPPLLTPAAGQSPTTRKARRKKGLIWSWSRARRLIRQPIEKTIFDRSYEACWPSLRQWTVVASRLGVYAPELALLTRMRRALSSEPLSQERRQAFLMGNIVMQHWQRLLSTTRINEERRLLSTSQTRKEQRLLDAPQPFWRDLWHIMDDNSPEHANRYFSFSGWEHLEQAVHQGKGVILLSYHSPGAPFTNHVISRRLGRKPILTVAKLDTKQRALAHFTAKQLVGITVEQTVLAHQQLRLGEIVHLANDHGYTIDNTLPCAIAGRQYNLKVGFVEMAAATGAAIIPKFTVWQTDGCIHTTFLPAFQVESFTPDDPMCARSLLDQYAVFLESSWRTAPESLLWDAIEFYFKQPIVT